jgi:hypothetical protein
MSKKKSLVEAECSKGSHVVAGILSLVICQHIIILADWPSPIKIHRWEFGDF